MNIPKPVQKPHPPIMVGGEGDKILGVAAELADEVNIPTLEKAEERIHFVHNYCDTVGRNPKEMRFSLFPRLVFAKDETALEPLIKRYQPKDQSREEFEEATLVGTPETVLDRIQGFIDLGVSRFAIIMSNPIPERLELFSSQVMSQFS